jgi:hypothetical protein
MTDFERLFAWTFLTTLRSRFDNVDNKNHKKHTKERPYVLITFNNLNFTTKTTLVVQAKDILFTDFFTLNSSLVWKKKCLPLLEL